MFVKSGYLAAYKNAKAVLAVAIEEGDVSEVRRIVLLGGWKGTTSDFLSANDKFGFGLDGVTLCGCLGPLQLAVSKNQPDIITVLVEEYGAKVDSLQVSEGKDFPGSWTSLLLAVYLNDLLCVDALLKAGADHKLSGSIKSINYQSALDMAEKLEHAEIADKLKQWDNVFKLSDAIKAGNCVKVGTILTEMPSLLNIAGSKNRTPLEQAIALEETCIMKLLLTEFDCSPNSRSTRTFGRVRGSWTCLHLAIHEYRPEAFNLLLKKGADWKMGGEINGLPFKNALDLAKHRNQFQMVEQLKAIALKEDEEKHAKLTED